MPGVDADGLAELADLQRRGGRRWTVGGVKFMIDGTIDNGTAWLEQPDALGESTASFWPDPAAYTRAVRQLAAAGIPTATHAIGDAAVRHVLDALDGIAATPAGPAPGRAHRDAAGRAHRPVRPPGRGGQHAADALHPLHAGRPHRQLVHPPGRRPRRPRWRCRDLHDAGVPLVLGSDWPVAPFDPRRVLADAQLRRPAGEPDVPPVQPHQGLDARTALRGYTSTAAFAAGEAGRAGRITAGARADLTAFLVDPLTAAPDELAEAPIALTIVDGDVAHRPR